MEINGRNSSKCNGKSAKERIKKAFRMNDYQDKKSKFNNVNVGLFLLEYLLLTND